LNLEAEALAQLDALASDGWILTLKVMLQLRARIDYAKERLRLLYVGIHAHPARTGDSPGIWDATGRRAKSTRNQAALPVIMLDDYRGDRE